MGYGEYENLIKKFASKYINIHFQDAVKTEEISIYTSSADIGLHVAENKSLSYYYSLPNKFFEYIHANLPVIVSEFPEMVNVLNKYECGWAVAPENQNEFKNLVLSITFDDINKKSNQLRRCAEDFSWQKESEIYRTIYL
jgi:glycosyltransferase involved in cell wall biosynthesis